MLFYAIFLLACSGRTLQTDPVALQALQSLLEELLAVGGHARDIVLFPLNGSVGVLKDLLDGVGDFLTDTVTGNESDLWGTTRLSGCLLHATLGIRTV